MRSAALVCVFTTVLCLYSCGDPKYETMTGKEISSFVDQKVGTHVRLLYYGDIAVAGKELSSLEYKLMPPKAPDERMRMKVNGDMVVDEFGLGYQVWGYKGVLADDMKRNTKQHRASMTIIVDEKGINALKKKLEWEHGMGYFKKIDSNIEFRVGCVLVDVGYVTIP